MSFAKKFQLFLKTLFDRNTILKTSEDKFTSYDKLEISDYLKTILHDDYDGNKEFTTVMSIVQSSDEIDESLELLDILSQNLGLQLFLGKLECVRNYNTESKEFDSECYYFINKITQPFQENKATNWNFMKFTQHQFKTIPALTFKNMESNENFCDQIRYQPINNNNNDSDDNNNNISLNDSIQDLYYTNYTGGDREDEEDEEYNKVKIKDEPNTTTTPTPTKKTKVEIKKRYSRPIDVLLIIKKSNIRHVVNSCYTKEFDKTLKLLELHVQDIEEAINGDGDELEETEIEELNKETSNLIIDHLKQYPLSKTSITLPEPIEQLIKSNAPNYSKRINRAHIERYFYDPIAFFNNMDKILPILESSSSSTINRYKHIIENTLIALQPSKLDPRYPFPLPDQPLKVIDYEFQETFTKCVLERCKMYIELLLPMHKKFPQFINQKIIFSFYKLMIYYSRFSNYKYLRVHHVFAKKVESILDTNQINSYKQSISVANNKTTTTTTKTTTTTIKPLSNLGNFLLYEKGRSQEERLEKKKRKRNDESKKKEQHKQPQLPTPSTPPEPRVIHKLKLVRRKKLTDEEIKENLRKYFEFGL